MVPQHLRTSQSAHRRRIRDMLWLAWARPLRSWGKFQESQRMTTMPERMAQESQTYLADVGTFEIELGLLRFRMIRTTETWF